MAFSCNEDGVDNVGSDSLYIGDGRWNMTTFLHKAREHYSKLVNKPYGFRICTGTILNPTYITDIIKIK